MDEHSGGGEEEGEEVDEHSGGEEEEGEEVNEHSGEEEGKEVNEHSGGEEEEGENEYPAMFPCTLVAYLLKKPLAVEHEIEFQQHHGTKL